ncbi:hypothetical protein AACH06_28285 [Ideonella sp. DXS29W]|uniref:Uncharacterized protein n=1 Tax=Ideonella lacteola TaxID=2984193 RepID=A0ABU9BXM5_9BURK
MGTIDIVLRQARKLHLAAKSDSLSSAMPVLRRIHAAGIFPSKTLFALHRERGSIQRKHLLRLLAIEAGYPDWERFRPELAHWSPEALEHFKVADEWTPYLNAWFASEAQASAYAQAHGGRVVRYGPHAVVQASDAAMAEGARS